MKYNVNENTTINSAHVSRANLEASFPWGGIFSDYPNIYTTDKQRKSHSLRFSTHNGVSFSLVCILHQM